MIRIAFLLTMLASLAGCSPSDPYTDLRAFIEEVESRPSGKIQPPPKFEPYEFFTYSAVNMRAPFERPVDVAVQQQQRPKGTVKPDFDRVKEQLEEFRFDSLTMVGTIQKNADPRLWALISDSEGDVHQVIVGNFLGKNHGRILKITQTQIDVMEIVPDGQGGWLERPRTILLSGINQ